jgi:large subunit ribosomal protein L25
VPERQRLAAEPRTVLGKKVRRLRREGLIPANLVQAGRASIAMQVSERALADLVRAQTTGQLVDLESPDATEPVLMDAVEIDTLTNRLVHVTLRKIDISKPIELMVRVSLTGHAPASDDAEVVVIQNLQEVEVTALPIEIPSSLIADVSSLEEIGDEVRVRDLRAADGAYEPLNDPDEPVIQVIAARQVEEETPEDELEEVLLEEGAVPVPDGEAVEATEEPSAGPGPGRSRAGATDSWAAGGHS